MEDKVRVFEIAEEAGSTSTEVIKKAADLEIVLKSPQSTVSIEEAGEIAGYIMTGKSKLLKPIKRGLKKQIPKKVSIKNINELEEPTDKTSNHNNLNILLNLNEDKYNNDSYFTLLNQLKDLMEIESITIDDYFEAITSNYSNWGESFYISNISINEDKPYLLFRPKLRPKLLELFPDNFTIGFKVSPNIDAKTNEYKPFFINEFVKLFESEKRDWETEIICNIDINRNSNKEYLNNSFVQNLSLISEKTKEKTLEWYDYLEWKCHAEISISKYYEISTFEYTEKEAIFKLTQPLTDNLSENLSQYSIYMFSNDEAKTEIYKINNKKRKRLIYIGNKDIIFNPDSENIFRNHFDYAVFKDGYPKKQIFYNSKEIEITIKNINRTNKNYIENPEKICYIVFFEKSNMSTITKQASNINIFSKQGGNAPFLSSYLFDIKNARLPYESTQLDFYNKKLTDEQKKSVQIMYDSPDIALIQGPPGTGKTTVIAECIYQYVKQGKKVMLTSESNDAVDNALERLFDEPDVIPLRLISEGKAKKLKEKNEELSQFSKDDATKTYYQETLANPAKRIIEELEKKEVKYKESSTYYNELKSLEDKNTKYTHSHQKIQDNIKLLNKEYSDLISKKKEIEVANQDNENFTNLIEKIENNNLNIKTIGDGLSENIIDIFNNIVLVKTEKLTTNFFKTKLTDTEKSTYVRTNYIYEGLDKFFKSQEVLSKAKFDLPYIKSLKPTEIVKKETLDKIEELEYKIRDAKEIGDKKAYDEYRKEKSKLEREKGLNIEEYIIDEISFVDKYFIKSEQIRYENELDEIKSTLSKKEDISLLENDIININKSIDDNDNEILKLKQNLEKEHSSLQRQKSELESLNNNIQNLENDKKNLENNSQKYLTSIKSFELFDMQKLLENLELSSSSIIDTRNELKNKMLTKKQITQKLDDQESLKIIVEKLNKLNEMKKELNILSESKSTYELDLKNQLNFKSQLVSEINKNLHSVRLSKEKLEKFKNNWSILKKFDKLFNKEEKENNKITSLTNTNHHLSSQKSDKDKEINNIKNNITKLESDILSITNELNQNIELIKSIKLHDNNENISSLHIDNIETIDKKIQNNIWSNGGLEEFKIIQKNLVAILDEIEKLENEFEQLTQKLSKITKLKKEKESIYKNNFTTQKNIDKLLIDIDKKNITKLEYENELVKTKNKQKKLKESSDSYNEDELLIKEKNIEDDIQKLFQINSPEKQYDYLNNKIGQNGDKNEAINLLKYFIDTFENESDIYNDSLKTFIERSQQYILDNPIEKFDDNVITITKNEIIVQNNDLEKISVNIANIEDKIKNIKSELKYKPNTTNLEILEDLKKKIEENKTDNNESTVRPLIENWIKNIEEHVPTPRENETYFSNVNVVGITLNASEKMLKDIDLEYFDVVIVDEISKSTPPEYLRGMMRAKKAILVGDHRQLPPLFSYHGQDSSFEDASNDEEHNELLSKDNFKKYKDLVTASQFQEFFTEADDKIKYRLTKQFRMHTDIMDLINCFYGGQLTQGIHEDSREHNKEKIHNIYIPNFIEKKDHAIWVDTSKIFGKEYNQQTQDGTSKKNLFEAFLTIEALKKIDDSLYQQYKDGEEKLSIGIISFYLGQVKLLNEMVKKCNLKYFDIKNKENIMISSVDSFQGRDRDVILVDLISTKRKVGKENFVSSFQRINVAFSRAKRLLVIFGSKDIFDDYEVEIPNIYDEKDIKKEKVYRKIANIIRQKGCNKETTSVSDLNTWNIEKKKYGYKNEQN